MYRLSAGTSATVHGYDSKGVSGFCGRFKTAGKKVCVNDMWKRQWKQPVRQKVAGRMIRNLSKGYRQRVGFAQAILGYPEIIILDEPTVGLDPKQIIEIRELIRHLGEKHTVILSSHILPEISAVCDHVFIISKGKLVASDSTENLVNLMSGAQEIELTVRTGAGEAAGYLQGEENIARVEQADHDKIRIYAKKGADVREEVFRQMAEHNVLVLEMKTVTKSLEDVFLEITQEGGAQ